MLGLLEALLNPAGKVALRKLEEFGEMARVRQRAIKLVLVTDIRKELCHRNDSMRLFVADAQRRAHRFQKLLQLAEQQVILVAVVKIKGGAADRGAVQYILHRPLVELPLQDQRQQSAAQPLTRTPDALIRLAPLLSLSFPLLSMFLQSGALILGPFILGHVILGHGPPLCSVTRDGPGLCGI